MRVLCIVFGFSIYFVLFLWLNVKNLKTFSRFVWWLGRKVLTLQPEIKKNQL